MFGKMQYIQISSTDNENVNEGPEKWTADTHVRKEKLQIKRNHQMFHASRDFS